MTILVIITLITESVIFDKGNTNSGLERGLVVTTMMSLGQDVSSLSVAQVRLARALNTQKGGYIQ